MPIIDLFALQGFAQNLERCNFRVLQHNLPLSNSCAATSLFDRLIGFSSDRLRHGETERLCYSQVDDQIELVWQLHRQIGGRRPAQYPVDVDAGASETDLPCSERKI